MNEQLICTSISSLLNSLYGQIYMFASPLKLARVQLLAALNLVISDYKNLVDVSQINNALSDAVNSLDPGEIGSAFARLSECLGGFSIDPKLPNLGVDLLELGDLGVSFMGSFLDDVMGGAEQEVFKLIKKIEDMIPIASIDKMLGISQCLAGCPNGSPISLLDIEAELNGNGLTITGEIDLDQLVDPDDFDSPSDASAFKSRINTLKVDFGGAQESVVDGIKNALPF